jgi:hypothetical protein
VTNAEFYRELAEDCLFAARQSSVKDVRDACMKDAAHFLPSPNGSSAGAKLTKASKAGIDFDAEVTPATRCHLQTVLLRRSCGVIAVHLIATIKFDSGDCFFPHLSFG